MLNKPYRCRHCGKPYVILSGYGKFGSYLPVDIINGTEKNDATFDKDKHVSHLTQCPELQKQWEEVKKIIDKSMKQSLRELTK